MAWKPVAAVFPIGSDASSVVHKQLSLLRDIQINLWKGESSPQGPAVNLKRGTRGYVLKQLKATPDQFVLAMAEYGADPTSLDRLIGKGSVYKEVVVNAATLRASFYVDC